MSSFWSVFGNIILMLVILGVLISIHEAGHLLAAKSFNVYCFDYSIGFGPALIHKKRKNGETYFSLRAFPFGGYVSMYGEADAVPEGVTPPPEERSLEHVAKWKKSIIMLAGVTMNFLLGMVLVYVSDCLPRYYSAYLSPDEDGAQTILVQEYQAPVLTVKAAYSGEIKSFLEQNEQGYEASDYYLWFPMELTSSNGVLGYGVNGEAKVSSTETEYYATYVPTTLVSDHDLASSLTFYQLDESSALDEGHAEVGFPKAADTSKEKLEVANLGDNEKISLSHLYFLPIGAKAVTTWEQAYAQKMDYQNFTLSFSSGAPVSSGISILTIKENPTFALTWKRWAGDFPAACEAIIMGFVSLFKPHGINNLSGIVGMTAALPQLEALGGAANVLYFAGAISVNLAFFNLLPFPGLDGWGLLTTIIEAITKKKISEKVKGVVQFSGLAILMALMVFVTIKDIVGLF